MTFAQVAVDTAMTPNLQEGNESTVFIGSAPSFYDRVAVVIATRTEPKMRRIYAMWNVTAMQDANIVGNWSDDHQIDCAVYKHGMTTANAYYTVAEIANGPAPQPATFRFVFSHLRHNAREERNNTRMVRAKRNILASFARIMALPSFRIIHSMTILWSGSIVNDARA